MFIITDKVKLVGEVTVGVGVMKDEELKFEEIESSHTLGGVGRSYTLVLSLHDKGGVGEGDTSGEGRR